MAKSIKKVVKKKIPLIKEEPVVLPVPYFAKIKVLGHIYEATGQTAVEAITNLKPLKGRGVSILTVNKDGKERSKILNRRITMRLFSPSHTAREMGLKGVIGMFSDL